MRCNHLTLAIPYQPGGEQAHGKAMHLGQRVAIHFVAQQVLGVHSVGNRHAAGKMLRHLDVANVLHARVAAEEDDLDALVEHTRFLEERRQWRACPGGVADGTREERQAVIAGALSVKVTSWRGRAIRSSRVTVIGCWNQPPDLHAPCGCIEHRLVIVSHREELVVGSEPAIECFPLQLWPTTSGTGFGAGWSSQGRTSSPG